MEDPTQGGANGDLLDAEGMAERLREYRLDRFVTTLPEFPETRDDIRFDPDDPGVREFYVRAAVESLDDLKLWTGIPNHHIDHTQHTGHLPCVNVPTVASLDALMQIDAQVIADAEYTLLNGYVDDTLLSHPFWGAVAAGLLGRFPSLPILTLSHLVVQDRQTVVLTNTPTTFFDRITVHGSGRLDFQSDAKVIVRVFEHIASTGGKGQAGGAGRPHDHEGR